MDDTKAVFLGTDNHTEGTFGDVKWIEILHDHYPKLIASYKDDRITEIYPKVTAKERQTLWDKGYTLGMTKVRDVVYHNPGIGRMTSGDSMLVVTQVDRIMRWIYLVSEQLTKWHEPICSFLGLEPRQVNFKLRLNGIIQIIYSASHIVLLSYPELVNEELFNQNGIQMT